MGSSPILSVTSGVPQGSVLGPLLFLIYCNDIADVIEAPVNIRLFTDDYIIFKDINTVNDQLYLHLALNIILEWSKKWGMKLNTDKYVLLCITNKKLPLKFSYSIGQDPLAEVSEYKYLGITITNNLNWNSHIAATASSAFRKLCLLRHKLKHASHKVKPLAYAPFIRPKL